MSGGTGDFNPDQETTYDPNCPVFNAMRVYPPKPATVVPGSYQLNPAQITRIARYTNLSATFNDGTTRNFQQ